MKVSPRDAEGFVKAPKAGIAAVLLYGPDSGLVRERAEQLVAATTGDANDPFAITEIPAEQIKSDPARIADELGAISFGGGRRAIRVRQAGNAHTDAFLDALDAQADLAKVDALLIVEAGELDPRASLRKFFETDTRTAAIACYADDGRTLSETITTILRERGLSVERDALAFLLGALGGDRYVIRQEIEKLALYAHGKTTATLDDAMQAVGDSGARNMDDIVMAAAEGNHSALDAVLETQLAEGAAPVQILRAAIRYFQRLHLASGHMAGGRSAEQAMDSLRPKVFYKTAPRFRMQLAAWPRSDLASTLDRLLMAEVECKRTGAPDTLVVGRTLMGIANLGARHTRRRPTSGAR